MFLKKYVQFVFISLVFSLLISGRPCESWAGEKKLLVRGAGPTTSGTFTYFVNSTKILNDKIPEINITVRATGGVVHAAKLLTQRETDIGPVDTMTAWDAIQGKGTFDGKSFPDIRLLYVTMTNPLQFVVSEKSGIKDIYGLEGKNFIPGTLGSSAEKIAMEINRILGVRPKIRHAALADAVEAMKNEMAVGLVKFGTPPDATIMDIASGMKIRLLSLSDEDMDKILKNVVGLRKTVVPSGTYPGVGEFKALENEYADYVNKDFPSDLAYRIVKNIWEQRAEIKKANSMFLGDRLTEVTLGVKVGYLHPGSVRFYRELGLTVPRNLVPPEMGEK